MAQGISPEAIALTERAIELDKGQHFAEAVALYEQAVRLSPSYEMAWSNMAADYVDLSKPAEAERAAKKALEINPKRYQAWNTLGTLAAKRGDNKRAVELFKNALAIHPDYPKCLFNIGLAYYDMKLYQDSVAAWQKLVQLDPNDYEGWHNLSYALRELGRLEEASKAMQRSQSMKPHRE